MKSHAGHEEELSDAAPTFAVLHLKTLLAFLAPVFMGQTA